jgi:hypothetical protein
MAEAHSPHLDDCKFFGHCKVSDTRLNKPAGNLLKIKAPTLIRAGETKVDVEGIVKLTNNLWFIMRPFNSY